MTDIRTAAQQALETLNIGRFRNEDVPTVEKTCDALRAALAGAEGGGNLPPPLQVPTEVAALAEPDVPETNFGNMAVAEPVAYSVGRTLHWHACRGVDDAQLYAAPPQREPYDQTALGLCNSCGWKAVGPDGCLNCAPQREREPLTDEQIDDLSREMVKGGKSVNWLCRAIERAHGIKEQP